jgi:hypothetical protein
LMAVYRPAKPPPKMHTRGRPLESSGTWLVALLGAADASAAAADERTGWAARRAGTAPQPATVSSR